MVNNIDLELHILNDISLALSSSFDLAISVHEIFDILDKKMGMSKATLTLLDQKTGDISIKVAHGMNEAAKRKGKYRLGEGITGKVIHEGQVAVIPKIGDEPLFLNKTGSRGDLSKKDISFICVPVKIKADIMGALSVDKLYKDHVNLDKDVRFLTIIASMIGQAFKLKQTLEEEKERLISENLHLRSELKEKYNIHNMIGNSNAMHKVYEEVQLVCASTVTVLIRGESGTGKELVAHAIHYNSPRSEKPFVKVNCGSIPENLLESELFGYEKGAFTGALEQKIGKFELASSGTIFLDEICELAPSMQVKLLRVLQEKDFERVGGLETIKVDVRILAATNRDIEKEMQENRFREDLYYRLNVFSIFLPSLKDRQTDTLLLAEFFLNKYSKEENKDIKRISTLAIDLLNTYHWPGNVRELENCMQRAVLLCHGDVIQANHLPPTLQRVDTGQEKVDFSLSQQVENFEKEIIIDALKKTRGNKANAAVILHTSERVLGYKVEKYKIDFMGFRK